MKKQTGVWLDFKEAWFIELEHGQDCSLTRLTSHIDFSPAKGGAPAGGRQGGTFVGGSEKGHHEYRQQQEHRYFDAIIKVIGEADEVYVFGPGEAKLGLVNHIKHGKAPFHAHLREVETADYLTENQMVAQVREYFLGKN